MRFAVIQGSREWTETVSESLPPRRAVEADDVATEARRRLRTIKLDEWKVREFITGRPMPEDIRNLALQIQFAAEAIGRLSPIPSDFADDVYWPRVW